MTASPQTHLENVYSFAYGHLNAAYQHEGIREEELSKYWNFANTLTPEEHTTLLQKYLQEALATETNLTEIAATEEWKFFEAAFTTFITSEIQKKEAAAAFSERFASHQTRAAAEFLVEEYLAYKTNCPDGEKILSFDLWLLEIEDFFENAMENFAADFDAASKVMEIFSNENKD